MRCKRRGEAVTASDGYGGCEKEEEEKEGSEAGGGSWTMLAVGPGSSCLHGFVFAWIWGWEDGEGEEGNGGKWKVGQWLGSSFCRGLWMCLGDGSGRVMMGGWEGDNADTLGRGAEARVQLRLGAPSSIHLVVCGWVAWA